MNGDKHAYLIMAHADQYLLQALIGMLDDERNDIYLHADKKWRDFSASSIKVNKAHLYILDKRIDARWGHSSLIDVEYALFRAAYQRGGYAYYHLLSGADLPIKSQDYIHNFFQRHKGKEFVACWNTEDAVADAHYKVERYHFFMKYEKVQSKALGILVAKIRRTIADVLYRCGLRRSLPWPCLKGANWVSLTGSAIELLLSKQDIVRKHFRWTRNGEEIFLQSILWDSDLVSNVYSLEPLDRAALREIRWENSVHSPDTYTIADKEFLMNSEMLFARKFSTQIDKEIIDFISTQFS